MSYGIKKFILFLISFLKYFLYSFSNIFLNKTSSSNPSNSILLIKVDEIGDYILFRNYLRVVRNSKKYKHKKIILCGNTAWKNIFDNFDSEYVDEVVWLDKSNYYSNLFYRREFLNQMASRNFETVVNCSYSRNFYLDDTIIKAVNSSKKIGFKTDLATQFCWQKIISDKYYSNLIDADIPRFEFYKNNVLFEYLIEDKIEIIKPFINKEKINSRIELPSKTVAFYIGAKQKYRRWSIENYFYVANNLITKYQFIVALLGSTEDAWLAKELENKIERGKVINLTAKTKLVDTFKILSEIELFLTNDSGLAHIAIALDCRTIVLSNGSRFGRFFPYPKKITKNVKTLFPNQLEEFLCDDSYLQLKYKYTSDLNINGIEKEKVLKELHNYFKSSE